MSKLYISFIRPNIEYASIVWDGCSARDIEKLEKVQLSAARIVTGLPIFTSRESLYTETGWQTLQNRRYIAKMVAMFKIHNGGATSYLNDIIPDKHENISRYNTRNKHNNFIPRCRLKLFKKSFVPDSIRLEFIKEAISINSFRKNISGEIENPPSYYAFGRRFINTIHKKLR